MCQHAKPDTLPLAATTGTRRFIVNSGTLPSQAKNDRRTTTYRPFDPPRGSEPRCGIGVRCHQFLHRTVGVVRSEYDAVSSACARACGYRVLGWPYTWPETSERIDS
jgi:hypothetical protein